MPLTNEELERLEKDYLEQVFYQLEADRKRLMDGLNSKNKIRDDWWGPFQHGGKATDLDRGAERIFYWLLRGDWTPNSAPIGSNLFFEAHNAFIHIEVKTSRSDNPADYCGLVPLSIKQTSYPIKRIKDAPGLPTYYNRGTKDEKVCLTYAIHVIHSVERLEIIAILLICIPNGQLYELYGDRIVGGGKVKGASFRYRYKKNPYFESLPNRPYKVKFLYLDEKSKLTKDDITDGTITG